MSVWNGDINGYGTFYGEDNGLNGKNLGSLPWCIIYKEIVHVKREDEWFWKGGDKQMYSVKST